MRLIQLTDVWLMAVLLFAPLIMGGRHPLGRLTLVTIVCAAALSWTIGQGLAGTRRWRPTGAGLLLIAGLILVMLQLAPLPPSWLGHLSPGIADRLPAWSPDGLLAAQFGTWSCVSLMPHATRIGLVMYLGYAMLFVLVVQRIQRVEDVQRCLGWIAAAAVLIAAVGLAQYFFGNGRFLWIYEHPFRRPGGAARGPFVNPNHFAHFLALGIGPLCWWTYQVWHMPADAGRGRLPGNLVQREWMQLRRPASIVVLSMVALASALSFSRAGVVAVLLAGTVFVGLFSRTKRTGRRFVLGVAVAAGIVAAALIVDGRQMLARELRTITEARSLGELGSGRKKLWAADLRGVCEFLLLGTGVGTHRVVYPMYLEENPGVTYTHAENGYLQVCLESGLVGLSLLLVGITLCGWWCLQTYRRSRSPGAIGCLAAIAGGLTASVLHSVVDFVWYIPACMSVTIVLAACACRLAQLDHTSREISRSRQPAHGSSTRRQGHAVSHPPRAPFDVAETRVPRWAAIALAVGMAGASAVMIPTLLGPARAASYSDRYRTIARQGPELLENDPAQIEIGMSLLQDLLERDPDDAQAHLHMAYLGLRRFEHEQQASDNPMPLIQIRDAAIRSGFRSHQALRRWLAAAVGDRYRLLGQSLDHARQAVRRCPLMGEAYLYLAETAFLDGADRAKQSDWVEQAVRVRPHSVAVNFAVGREAALAGRPDEALPRFRLAFGKDAYYREKILDLFAGQDADFFLRYFDPDLATLQRLQAHYANTGREDDARKVARRYAAEVQRLAQSASGRQAADLWLQLQRAYGDSGQRERAVRCALKAAEAAPDYFAARRNWARVLLEEKRYAEAIPHLRWCLLRYPENDALQEAIVTAQRHAKAGQPVGQASGQK